jgi:hypothetical protein
MSQYTQQLANHGHFILAAMAFNVAYGLGALLMAAVFAVVPLSVCVMGAVVLGRLGRRRRAEATVGQLLAFGAVLVAVNMVALTAGILFWPRWWYSEKLATLMPLWPLTACFALNALLDAALVGLVLRSQLTTR